MKNKIPQSLYLKIFLSFLAICVFVFIALAVFWNYYFTDLFYKNKKELLQLRSVEVIRLLAPFQDETMSSRELRFGMRIIARSLNGQAWIVDEKGTVLYSSSLDRDGKTIPKSMEPGFFEALKGSYGYSIGSLDNNDKKGGSILTYYEPAQIKDKPVVIFLHTPVVEISEAIQAVRINILIPLLFSLLAVGIILYSLSRKLAGPLKQMNEAAIQLAEGDLSVRVSIDSNDELGQLGKSFNAMVDQLKNWEDTRQEFLANVSHELRSPLTTLRGLIVALNDKLIPPEKQEHYLKICDYEVQRLQRLVNDLLDLARIQNGGDVFRTAPVDLVEVVREVATVLATRIDNKRLQFHLDLPPEGTPPIVCDVDADRVAQVLQNLVYNAIQYTPDGGSISVSLTIQGWAAVLVVSDTGIGMSDDELKRIWDRFYKADESRGERTEGTGLGLTIVKHLVSGMKGTIAVSSEPEKGTTFTLRFPIC